MEKKPEGPYYVVVNGLRGRRKPYPTQAEAEAVALQAFKEHNGKRIVRVASTIGEIRPNGERFHG